MGARVEEAVVGGLVKAEDVWKSLAETNYNKLIQNITFKYELKTELPCMGGQFISQTTWVTK